MGRLRNRNIKSRALMSARFATLQPIERVVFLTLLAIVDRNGVTRYEPEEIALLTFHRKSQGAADAVTSAVSALVRRGLVTTYEVEGVRYVAVDDLGFFVSFSLTEPQGVLPLPPARQAALSQTLELPLPKRMPEVASPAQRIVAHFVAASQEAGLPVTASMRARLGKYAKELLDQGQTEADIRTAVDRMVSEGKPVALLGDLVRDVVRRRPSTPLLERMISEAKQEAHRRVWEDL